MDIIHGGEDNRLTFEVAVDSDLHEPLCLLVCVGEH